MHAPGCALHAIVGLFILLCCSQNCAVAKEDTSETTKNITVSPESVKQEIGKTVEVTCSSPVQDVVLSWTSPNGTKVQDLPSSRFNDSHGVLTITDAQETDSGTYTCSGGGSLEATADIGIYVMPDYFTEGMIILGINAVLIVIFFSCLIHSTIQNKRAREKYNKVRTSKA